jgi:hypothetical protein
MYILYIIIDHDDTYIDMANKKIIRASKARTAACTRVCYTELTITNT